MAGECRGRPHHAHLPVPVSVPDVPSSLLHADIIL